MTHSYTPAAAQFGRRLRITYAAALLLLFAARMWGVHGVYDFFAADGKHGEMVAIGGRLAAQSADVAHAAFLRAYAPQTPSGDILERAIGTWAAQHAKAAQILVPVCAVDDAPCEHLHALEVQMRAVAAAARAAAQAPSADRTAALERLTALQGGYGTAANTWVQELTARSKAQTGAQQHSLLLLAIGQVILTILVVAAVVEPLIRRLQRERSEGDRAANSRQELLSRLQKMGSQLPGMLYQYRLRPDGTAHFPYSSEGIRQIYGVSPESVREDAGGVMAALHPEDLPRMHRTIADSAAQLTQWREEYRVRLPDGRERWVLGNAAPEREPDGSVLWHGFITDVTERRNAMQAIADARTLLQSVLDAATESAIIATDVNGLITVFNSGAERMLHYRAADMIGRADPLGVHLEDEVAARSRECTYVRKDGSRLTVSLSVTAIRNAGGEINGYLSVATDVTERRQARESLQAAKDAAERANRAKSEFLATMSHEIRTPMNGVLGFANLLRDTPLDAEQRDFVGTIERSGQNLLAIINDILDFSKIEAGAMNLENIPFDLSDALEEVVALMAGKAEEKRLELGLSIGPSVPERIVADPGRLKQILVNLIGNAVKFTSLGHVHIEVGTIGTDADCKLHIRVRDTGIGIPQAAQAGLFQKFAQADASTTRRYGGTGLGLAICRQLVGLMGGEIGVDSIPGAGSTFWLTIPVKATEAAGRSAAPEEIAGRRVLIVDDLEMNRRVLESQLTGWGAECTCADGGRQALTVLEKSFAAGRRFDVALIDHLMPDVDGAELGEMLHADPRFGGLRLILLTTSEQIGNARELLARGFSAYLTKPVVRSRLLRDAMCRALAPAATPAPKPAAAPGAAVAPKGAAAPNVAATPSPRAAVGVPAPPHLTRVLVAEDNSVNQMVAVRLLERLGCRVDVAGNGAEAVHMAARLPYDLVFMDCHMPDMDGFDATVEIRRRESDTGVAPMPIVALTASVLQVDRDRCVSAGMNDIIGKPVQPAELAQVLGRFANRR
jgi:PAS domain S-box-containing protein